MKTRPDGTSSQQCRRSLLEQRLKQQTGGQGRMPAVPGGNEPAPAPLSFAEERMRFLWQFAPDEPAYNSSLCLHLRGPLDVPPLEQALNELVRRHEVLRAHFPSLESQPVQVVRPWEPQPLLCHDLLAAEPEAREKELHALVSALVLQPYNLAAGPVMRMLLAKLAPAEHVLALAFHHIVFDGWSGGVIAAELSELYPAFKSGQPPGLPRLPIQYADYARWQREQAGRPEFPQDLAWWLHTLSGELPVLELPIAQPRPDRLSGQGAGHELVLPVDLAQDLRAFCQAEGVTTFMVLLAAYAVLLHRYTGDGDFIVGCPVAGRTRPETELLVGCFINTLPLRCRVRGKDSFREFLAEVRRTVLDAFEHQTVPFEKLVEALNPPRTPNRTPVFQTLINARSGSVPASPWGELAVTPWEFEDGLAQFDLALDVAETGRGIRLRWRFRTDLLRRDDVRRLADGYATLLRDIAAHPAQRVSDLRWLPEEERHKLLVEWNRTATNYPRDQCIHQLFEGQVERTPEAVALAFADQQLTYDELNHRANQLAHWLRAQGVGPETLVGLCVRRSFDLVVGMLGILKAGGAYLPLHPDDPPERLAFMLGECAAPVVLTQMALRAKLPAVDRTRVICLDAERELFASQPPNNPRCHTTPDGLAYVMYTSGSTGSPKGVAVVHRGVVRLVRGADYARFSPEEVFLQLAPSSFDAATFEIWGPLLNGGRLVIMPPGRASLAEIGAAIRRHEVTTLWLTAGLFHLMVEQQIEDLKRLRQLLAGGDVLSVTRVRRFLEEVPGCRLINGYGPTENTTFTCCHPVSVSSADGSSIPIGRPIANTQVHILDVNLQPVPVGVPGELCIGGDGLARGYWQRPELTAKAFVANPFSHEPGARLYRSGDRARWRPDGTIEFLGRQDRQAKVRGYRVEPGEVEARLRELPAVREAAVVIREEPPGHKRLVGYVEARAGMTVSPEELREALKRRLPEYLIPAAVVRLDALPLGSNGKVDRSALPAPAYTDPAAEEDAGLGTSAEQTLAGIWRELLGLESVGRNDSFFELGGHSLLAIRLVACVRQAFHVDLPVQEVFEHRTLGALARRIVEQSTNERARPPMPRRARTGEAPASFAQERMWFLRQSAPAPSLYNVALTLRLAGRLDGEALRRSLTHLADRHAALRTTFTQVDGVLRQRVLEPTRTELPVQDLSGQLADAREIELQSRCAAAANEPLDLEQGPVWRPRLFRLAAEEHLLLLVFHHICIDEWSLQILVRELAACYERLTAGAEARLPDLPWAYVDFAAWQRHWLGGGAGARQLDYWCHQLTGRLPSGDLPADRPHPARTNWRGARQRRFLSRDLAERLRALGQSQDATFFVTLLAAFQVMLHRSTGQEEVVLGTPITNRGQPETLGVVGLFLNTLVIRTNLGGDPSFAEILRRVRQVMREACAHPDVPFQQVVGALRPRADQAGSPLFRVMFVVSDGLPARLQMGGLRVTLGEVHNPTAKFDLTWHVVERESGPEISVEYRTELFEPATIERMLGDFEFLLAGVIEQPDVPISRLPATAGGRQCGQQGELSVAPGEASVTPSERSGAARLPITTVEGSSTVPGDELERGLARIWERHLGVRQVGVRDDFFALGGNSLLALSVFSDLAKLTGTAQPLSLLFEAPTIAQQAALLRREGTALPASTMVAVQPLGSRLPLFCVPGAGVDALCFRDLARQLGEDQPFYSFTAPGFNGRREPLDDITALADCYVREMRRVQAEGPYQIGGLSFGGLVAWEMACQLQVQGQAVSLLVLLDTYGPALGKRGRREERGPWHRRTWELGFELVQKVRLHGSMLAHLPPDQRWPYLRDKSRHRLALLFGGPDVGRASPLIESARRVYAAHLKALRAYQPPAYPGHVTLLRGHPHLTRQASGDHTLGWSGLAGGGLEVHDLPGFHHFMVAPPFVDFTASKLQACLAKTQAPVEASAWQRSPGCGVELTSQ